MMPPGPEPVKQLSPADAELAVKAASHARLANCAMAAVTGGPTELATQTLTGIQLDRPRAFWCPACQVDVNARAFRPGVTCMSWPTAEILDSVRWRCDGFCHRTGTRWVLERLVLENLPALAALLEVDG